MSASTDFFREMVLEKEKQDREKIEQDLWRTRFHIMPPTGWLNDPNGLCQYQGKYCFFFQYAPFSPKGGLKFWGKYTSRDLLDWKYEGTVLFPDSSWDCHGVYSGSAFVEDGSLELFYTGNVKLDGDYDYIRQGREAYVIHTQSQNGESFGAKKRLLGPEDYPKDYTAHIRDPKVWKEGETYYMVLGGRREEDKGAVLLYSSKDKKHWELVREITTEEPFGYMWECPDLFALEGQKLLSVSPQGVEREEFRFQNVYQSGYFPMDQKGQVRKEEFIQWDMGFDFYAPQTFLDERGRRILAAWAGLPDIEEEYRNPTVEKGWQHVLTTPRELTWKEGRVLQYPVEETKSLRGKEIFPDQEGKAELETDCFDLIAENIREGNWEIRIQRDCQVRFRDGIFSLSFTGDLGGGRKERKTKLREVRSLRILGDTSLLEIYVNEGEYVFTSRYYPKERGRRIDGLKLDGQISLYEIG